MKTTLLLPLFCLLLFQASAQNTTYKFRIRYADYGPMANSGFVISGQKLNTDPQGIIEIPMPTNISYVNIGSVDTKLYIIKYPLEGRAVLPKDPTVFIDIFVSKPSPDEMAVTPAQLLASQTNLQNNVAKRLDEDTKKGYDQIVTLLKSQNLDDTTLARGRLEFLPLISTALNNYLLKARNLRDAFSILGSSLNNGQSYAQLTQSIYSYNEIFDVLNANKTAYEQAISTYWNSKELSLKFSSTVGYAIENFHRPYILELNYDFTPKVYQFNNETNKKKRADLQRNLSQEIQNLSDVMSRRLNELEVKITEINTLLNNNKRIDN